MQKKCISPSSFHGKAKLSDEIKQHLLRGGREQEPKRKLNVKKGGKKTSCMRRRNKKRKRPKPHRNPNRIKGAWGKSTYNRKQRNFTCSVVLMHHKWTDKREKQRDGGGEGGNRNMWTIWIDFLPRIKILWSWNSMPRNEVHLGRRNLWPTAKATWALWYREGEGTAQFHFPRSLLSFKKNKK